MKIYSKYFFDMDMDKLTQSELELIGNEGLANKRFSDR